VPPGPRVSASGGCDCRVIDSHYEHVRVWNENDVTESKCEKALSSLVLCFFVFCESLSNQRVVFKVVRRHLVPRAGYGADTECNSVTYKRKSSFQVVRVRVMIEKISS